MKDYAKFIGSLILLGSNGVVAAHILLPSQDIVFLRTLIGVAALAVIFKMRHGKPECLHRKREFLLVVASGLSMGISWLFLYEAYRLVGVGVSSLAYYCAPILVMILSPVVFHEHLTIRSLVSFAVVLAGALLVNGQTVEAGGSAWGMLCGWMSAVAHAAMVVFSKAADTVDGLESSTVQLIASFAVALVFLLVSGGFPLCVDGASWPWIALLGLANTGLGCYLYFSSFGGLRAQTVAILGYIEPLSALACAFIFLEEPMSVLQACGGALILSGAAMGTLATVASKGERGAVAT